MYVFYLWQVSKIGGGSIDVGIIVVNTGYQGNTDNDPAAVAGEHFKVFKYLFIGNPRIMAVFFSIYEFQVEQKKIGQARHTFQRIRICASCGVQGPVNILLCACFQERQQKRHLHQGFPTGKSDPAAGSVIKGHIFADYLHDRFHGFSSSNQFAGAGRTDIHTDAAVVAYVLICNDPVNIGIKCFLRTDLNAFQVTNAFAFVVNHPGRWVDAFGVVAPGTGERATLEKHRCPDSGPSWMAKRFMSNMIPVGIIKAKGRRLKANGFAKSLKMTFDVIPAKAGIQ